LGTYKNKDVIVSVNIKRGNVDKKIPLKIWICQNVRGLVEMGIIPFPHFPPLSPTTVSHFLPPNCVCR